MSSEQFASRNTRIMNISKLFTNPSGLENDLQVLRHVQIRKRTNFTKSPGNYPVPNKSHEQVKWLLNMQVPCVTSWPLLGSEQ